MEIKRLTCVECPIGCDLEVGLENGAIAYVKGNSCPRGKKYAETEVVAPRRIVTSTVRTTNGKIVAVKTTVGVLKEEIFDVMEKINNLRPDTPIKTGDIIQKDIAEGVDLIATMSME